MAKASDNLFPYVHLVPAVAPASPAAGAERLFLDSADSNKLKRKNSAGTVTPIEGSGGGGVTWGSWTALTSAGVTYATNLADFATPYSPCKIRRTSDNDVVELRGLLQAAAGIGSGTALLTLPTGYRPPINLVFIAYDSNANFRRLELKTDGTLISSTTLVSSGYFSITQIRFSTVA